MHQLFHLSARWCVAICIQCQHAVWPSNVAGYLKGAQHWLPAKETRRIRREVQETSAMQVPADFAVIRALDEPIPELKMYNDAWTCGHVPDTECREPMTIRGCESGASRCSRPSTAAIASAWGH